LTRKLREKKIMISDRRTEGEVNEDEKKENGRKRKLGSLKGKFYVKKRVNE